MSVDLRTEINRLLGATRGARVHWLLSRLAGDHEPLTLEQLREILGSLYRQPERFPPVVDFWRKRLGPHQAIAADLDPDGTLVLEVRDAKGRAWALRCRIGVETPHRIEWWSLMRPLPPSVSVRPARESDADAIAAVERACPIERDDGTRVTLARGRSLFAQMRLAEWCRIWLVEDDGAPIACDARSVYLTRIGEREVRLAYRFHTRVVPSHRRLGLNETLAVMLHEEQLRAGVVGDGGCVFIDPRNQVIREWSGMPTWQARPLRVLLRCDAVAGPLAGRRASRSDLPRLAELLNSAHGREELYRSWDSERLETRLTRAAEHYGLEHVWLDGLAAVGIWEDREQCILERDGKRDESVRATVLDWGFERGGAQGLASLERLLRARCADLAGRGITHLAVFASQTSPAASLLRSLAESIVDVEFQCTVAEPAEAAGRGLHVDPIYY